MSYLKTSFMGLLALSFAISSSLAMDQAPKIGASAPQAPHERKRARVLRSLHPNIRRQLFTNDPVNPGSTPISPSAQFYIASIILLPNGPELLSEFRNADEVKQPNADA